MGDHYEGKSDPDIAAMPGPLAYGALQAGCELVAQKVFRGRMLILRPGLVLGPYEYVGRLQALLNRACRGGRMLVAGDPSRPIQPVDVRDLATFALDMIDEGSLPPLVPLSPGATRPMDR